MLLFILLLGNNYLTSVLLQIKKLKKKIPNESIIMHICFFSSTYLAIFC